MEFNMTRFPSVMKSFVLVAGLVVGGAAAQAETLVLVAALNPAAEVPPKSSKATGTVQATFDTKSKQLHYLVNYKDLTGPATAAHFHGPAAVGVNAGVAVGLKGSLESPISGDATLTSDQASDLLAGKWYFNVHTAANPGGEIRGQMVSQ
jgi:hypothetical protein